MAEEKPAAERTEQPTPRRRDKAREDGDRLTSRELATAAAGVAGVLWLAIAAPDLAAAIALGAAALFAFHPDDLGAFHPLARLGALVAPLLFPLGGLLLLALLAAVGGQAATGGIGFNPGKLAPRAERLDPGKGLARMFGRRGLAELGKALAKATLLIGLTAAILWRAAPDLIGLSSIEIEASVGVVGATALRLMAALTLGLAVIAAIDLPIQLADWLRRLRMSRQEVRDEQKEQEGQPEVRAALRRMARDTLKRASRAGMAEADVVLTNPTHFAVALRWRPEVDAAPVIVARGRGLVAEVIRELAAEAAVPVLSYPSVTRALYFTGRVGQAIRPDLYAAVAVILAHVLRAMAGVPPPCAEAPPTARFDETGRRLA